MAQIPANPKLWAMLTAQARAHFRVYPSPAAAHWVHSEYLKKGGSFVDSTRKKPHHKSREESSEEKTKK